MYTKLLVAGAIQAFFISFMVTYFDLHKVDLGITDWAKKQLELHGLYPHYFESSAKEDERGAKRKERTEHKKTVIMTKDELKHYDGQKGSKGLYLALLGKLYDVQKGHKHYGPGGGYSFFTGRDASRSFVTGDFTEKGLLEDVTGLTHQDYLGLEEWRSFYAKDYEYIGLYYDDRGRPTNKLNQVETAIKEAHKWKNQQAKEGERFPSCNSEWHQGKGGRVWCSNKSGGVHRSWTGVPRQLFKPGGNDWRCACVKSTGPPQDSSLADNNKGDLEHPHLKPYAKCAPDSESCLTE